MAIHASRGAYELSRTGLTRRELSSKIGCSQGAVSMWRSGQRTPDVGNRKLMHGALGIAPTSWDEAAPETSAPAHPTTPAGELFTRLAGKQASAAPAPQPAPEGPGEPDDVERLMRIVRAGLTDLESGRTMATPGEISRISADLSRTLERCVRLSLARREEMAPAWHRLRATIVAVLGRHPEALRELLDAMHVDGDPAFPFPAE